MRHAKLFQRRHFPANFDLLCMRWYLKYNISYRHFAEMMQERGLEICHTTIYRLDSNLRIATGKAEPVVIRPHEFAPFL